MMILEHGDLGCGVAMMYHMPRRGYSGTRDVYGNAPKESIDEYVERFLSTTLKQKRMFTNHSTNTMMTEGFSANGVMKDGTQILHLRTVRDWLMEYPKRPATMIVLGRSQKEEGMGEVLEKVGFKLTDEYPNPIMSWGLVYMYVYPAVTREENSKLSVSWQKKMEDERAAMEQAGLCVPKDKVKPSSFMHMGLES